MSTHYGPHSDNMPPLEPIQAPLDHLSRMQKLYELSMTLSGDPVDIFRHIAHMIGELLDVKVVCLSEVRGNELYFLSVYVQGKIYTDAGICPLSITPCATVESSMDYRVYDNVAELFPEASFLKDHNAYSYCGFPSLNNNGKVIAVTCLLDDRPHAFSDDDHDILRIFGQRIGMEMERQHHLDAQKESEEELRKHRDQLEEIVAERTKQLVAAQEELIRKERLATLGQLTATVSHEIRNPLGAIKLSAYLLENEMDKDNEKMKQAMSRIKRNISRCDSIVDELQDFTRSTKLICKPTAIDSWLNLVLDEQEIPEEITLERALKLPNINIDIDQDQFRRVIINILDNACQAILDNRQSEQHPGNSRVSIQTRSINQHIEITISDTGPGIPDDVLPNIFEPLFSTKGFGVGLGMTIVKQIMEIHNGGIRIETTEGKGVTITLWLPHTQ